jgi:hypothetical protein
VVEISGSTLLPHPVAAFAHLINRRRSVDWQLFSELAK